MRWLFLLFLLVNTAAFSQCKLYRISPRGDTLNCVDYNDKKQGKWVVHVDELRGEPGYEEEGVYKNGKRDGTWHRYNLIGSLTAVENYRWGNKDGRQVYFDGGRIEHEESWKAFDPEKKFDTIDVPDLYDQYKYSRQVFKIEAYSLKHGTWKYYNQDNGSLERTENFVFGKLQVPVTQVVAKVAVDDTDGVKKDSTKLKVKPREILEYEKKNSGKKAVKVRDGKTGG